MRELYDEFFRVPKQGKIREKVMLVRTAVMVCIILACLAGMGFSAYAFFSRDIRTAVSTVQAANFDLDISITNEQGEPVAADVDGIYNLAVGRYTVLLKKSGTASTGFCVIERSDNDIIYHTAQLGVSGNENVSQINFTFVIGNEVSFKFTPHWGTSSYYGYENSEENYIQNNATLNFGDVGNSADMDSQTEETSKDTESETAVDEAIHDENLSKEAALTE